MKLHPAVIIYRLREYGLYSEEELATAAKAIFTDYDNFMRWWDSPREIDTEDIPF